MKPFDLMEALKILRLPRTRKNWDELIENAASLNLSHADFFRNLVADELAAREENKLQRLLASARFPYHKTVEEFDFRLRPELQRRVFDSYLEDSFVRESRSLVFIGPPGLGKTHLSVAVGIRMVHRGYRVKFTTVQDYLNRYLSAESPAQWKRYQAPFRKSDLLILDEFGYLAPDKNVAPLLYELISERYEKKATIITSNKSLKEWGKVLGDSSLASAIVDRTMHHGDVYYLSGESYRLRGKNKKKPRKKGGDDD